LTKQIVPDERDPTIKAMTIAHAIIASIAKVDMQHMNSLRFWLPMNRRAVATIDGCVMVCGIRGIRRGDNVTSSFPVEYVTGTCGR
jgi:hypothetical protein